MDAGKTIRLENEYLHVEVLDYGATLSKLIVKERGLDVVLGYDSVGEYQSHPYYFGATCGRVANRIGKGCFTLEDQSYTLAQNNGPNHLHGGIKGFDKVHWEVVEQGDTRVVLRYVSPHLEEGYPGTLCVEVTYELFFENLHIHYQATSDQDTLVNLTNHTYFNLDGHDYGSFVDHHHFLIYADTYCAIDAEGLPTGEWKQVKDTPFDFTHFHKIKHRIEAEDPQLQLGWGYDHHYVFREQELIKAQVYSKKSGICMSLITDQPGMQFYSGNYIEKHHGKGNAVYRKRQGFCFETQHMPDAIHLEKPASVVLKANETFASSTTFHFTLLD